MNVIQTINWMQIWELIILGVLLWLTNQMSPSLGAFLHLLSSQSLRLPYLDRFFRFLLQSPLHLNAITKPLSWLISSSGLLLGYLIHNMFWGEPNTSWEYFVLLGFSLVAILEIIDSILTFDAQYYYIDTYMDSLRDAPFFRNLLPDMYRVLDEKDFIRLARQGFVDMAIPQFFRLLISVGVTYHALASIGLIAFTSPDVPTIWTSIIVSFSLIDITGEVDVPFFGTNWQILRLVSAFVVFFWLVMFVTLASNSVDEAAGRARDKAKSQSEDRMREFIATMARQFAAQQSNTNKEAISPAVKIIEALVNPPALDDRGHESVTLYNPSDQLLVLKKWQLEDGDRNTLIIPTVSLEPQEKHVIAIPQGTIRLRNSQGVIILRDQDNNQIDRVEYDQASVDESGVARWPER